jgi:hypothetical protein
MANKYLNITAPFGTRIKFMAQSAKPCIHITGFIFVMQILDPKNQQGCTKWPCGQSTYFTVREQNPAPCLTAHAVFSPKRLTKDKALFPESRKFSKIY